MKKIITLLILFTLLIIGVLLGISDMSMPWE
jgi:hypothetical protein